MTNDSEFSDLKQPLLISNHCVGLLSSGGGSTQDEVSTVGELSWKFSWIWTQDGCALGWVANCRGLSFYTTSHQSVACLCWWCSSSLWPNTWKHSVSDVYLANSLRRGAVQQERQGDRHLMCLVMLHPQSGSREGNAGLQLISIIFLFIQSGTPVHGMAPPNHGGSYPLLNVNTLTDTCGCFLDNSKFRRVDSGDQPSSYCLKIFI